MKNTKYRDSLPPFTNSCYFLQEVVFPDFAEFGCPFTGILVYRVLVHSIRYLVIDEFILQELI